MIDRFPTLPPSQPVTKKSIVLDIIGSIFGLIFFELIFTGFTHIATDLSFLGNLLIVLFPMVPFSLNIWTLSKEWSNLES